MPLRPLELARLHVESMYGLDYRGRITRVREPGGPRPPRFHLVRTVEGNLPLVADYVPDDLASVLLAAAQSEPPLVDPWASPVLAARYAEVLSTHERVVDEPARGPAFVLPGDDCSLGGAIRISDANAVLLERHFAWALPLDHAHAPRWVVVEEGAAVTICFSAREPSQGIEAGVFTEEAHRQRGHALRAVSAWAQELTAQGRVPLYSTSWDNVGSRRTAERLGGEMYGVDYSLQ